MGNRAVITTKENMYNNMIPEDNVNNYIARHLDDLVRVKRA